MTSPTTNESLPRLESKPLQQIATRVLHTMQLAAEKAVGHLASAERYPLSRDATLEHLFLDRLKQRPRERQQAAIERFRSSSMADRAARFGDLGRADLHSPLPIRTQVEAIPLQVRLTPGDLPGYEVTAKAGKVPSKMQSLGGLALRLHALKCKVETDGFLGSSSGTDTMRLGGVAVDAVGKVHKIPVFTVGKFDTGDIKHFSPPRTFTTFDFADNDSINVGGTALAMGWPRQFWVTFALAEEDGGGLPQFVQQLYEQAESYVVQAVASAAGAAIDSAVGAAVGTSIPGLGTAIGGAIGSALGWVMEVLWDWIVGWWEDDTFPPTTATLTVPSPNYLWGGEMDTPDAKKWWKAHGGHYELLFDWQKQGPLADVLSAVAWTPTHPREKKRIDVFGRGDNRLIYQTYGQPGDWSGWAPNLGAQATFSSGPASASWGPRRLDVFARGDDRRLWQKFWNGDEWSPWAKHLPEGTFRSGPAVVSWGKNRLDVFATGDDDRIYHTTWNGQQWSPWSGLGDGTFSTGPAAASWGENRLDVFSVGKDRRIHHCSWQPETKWTAWSPRGDGTFTSAPAAVSWGENRIDVFARGDDYGMYHMCWNNGWSGWARLHDETFHSGPAAISTAHGHLDVFALGHDRRVRRIAWSPGGGWSAWVDDMGSGTFS